MSASTFGCRPFLSADDMDTALLAAWEAAVRPGDEVWVLGDLALGHIFTALDLASALPGRKFLVPGNHDRCWAGHRKGIEKWHMEYEAAGLEVVDGPVKAALAGTGLLSHFPYERLAQGGPVPAAPPNRLGDLAPPRPRS